MERKVLSVIFEDLYRYLSEEARTTKKVKTLSENIPPRRETHCLRGIREENNFPVRDKGTSELKRSERILSQRIDRVEGSSSRQPTK